MILHSLDHKKGRIHSAPRLRSNGKLHEPSLHQLALTPHQTTSSTKTCTKRQQHRKQKRQTKILYGLKRLDRENKSGKLKYYMDLNVWTGKNMTMLWFFLSDLGEHKVILGYPWFTATQLRINWKKEWIDHSQLPIVLRAPNAQKATFIPRIRNVL
jgi:hypothetical protein